MPTASALLPLGDEHFVSLTTFRRSGVGVSTPVWIARDGDTLLVTTPDDTGKVKRVRNDGRVTLAPCTRMGKVADDAPRVEGVAAIEPETPPLTGIFRRKYRLEYRIFMFVERRIAKTQKPRVILRISAG